MLKATCLVNGAWVQSFSGETIEVRNPADGSVVGRVPRLSAAESPAVIAAAATAQKRWAALTAKERTANLRRWFELLLANAD
ncbi:aldehyde dehydrogenase family protein, partial [Ochrobactrum sp. GRS2]|nr:aldehyde dehydrogenase family protein [Ochrobactrum sp. GRS2]